LTTLAICNTIFIVDEDRKLIHKIDYEPKYEGDNVDDLVLCQAASNFGVRIISRSSQNLVVRYIDPTNTIYEDLQYEIVCLLPFDSTRRRMSIIVRLNNQIFLFLKGAESSIWSNLSRLNETYKILTTEQHSRDFSEQGYRSLAIGYRELIEKDFDHWFQRYQQTAYLLDNREKAISDLANEIETEIILSGLTAVEDKLQDGVPTAIQMLRCAGIKIWLLTGDKQETALSTAQAASLINISQTIILDMDVSGEGTIKDERSTHETIARINKIIPVYLVVTGEDLSKKRF
jgi:phospholipid-transporting ATPase